MKRFIPIILALSIFLSSCGGAVGDIASPLAAADEATPTMSVEEIRATADALVYEMLTQTALAMPTNTLVPPTETPLPPTATLEPTAEPAQVEPTTESVVVATEAVAAVPTVAVIPTNTMVTSSSSTYACTEKPLTSWDVPSINVEVVNTVKDTTAYVFLCIVTQDGQAGYITIPAGSSMQVPYGTVTATAWVDGAKSFNATIFFDVKTPDGRQLLIENGRLYYRGGCYPDC